MTERDANNISAAASGHGRIYQAGRDMSIQGVNLSGQSLRSVADVDAPSRLVNIPFTERLFVGRQSELDSMNDALAAPGGVVVVCGMGGVGKSTLAAQFASEHVHTHNPVWWITANSASGIEAGLAGLTFALQPGLAHALPMEESAERATHWLSAHEGWLLILDDATDPAAIAPLLPLGAHGHIVVTSRFGAGWHRAGATTIRLGALPLDSATELLTKIVESGRSDATPNRHEAADLVQRLGSLPLAIRIAANYIAKTCISVREYGLLLTRYEAELFDPSHAGDDGAAAGITGILRVSFERFADRPLALRLLRALAWYDPEGIPRSLLDGLGQATDGAELTATLAELSTHHMLDIDGDSLSMHRLLQTFARTTDRQDPHRQPADIAAGLKLATELLDSALPPVYAPSGWPEWRRLIPHITALANRAAPESDSVTTAHLFNQTGLYLNEQGDPSRSIEYHRRSHAAYARCLGSDHPDTLAALGNLAGAFQATGDVEQALSLYERALQECERVLGHDHPSTLSSMNDLAGAYLARGDLRRATPLLERSLVDRQRILGPEHPATLTSLNNVAYAYQAAGDPSRAIPLLEQALVDRERILGSDHPDTLASRHRLAGALHAVGGVQDAVRLLEQNLVDRERILGSDHPDTLTSRNSLAYAYLTAGDVRRAVPLLEQTLHDRERVLGPDHPDTLTSRSNLGGALMDTGDLDRAIRQYQETLAGCEQVLGPDHPDTLAARSNLAGAYRSAGDLELALRLYEYSHAAYERLLGADHPDTLASCNRLATAWEEAGDTDRALPLLERTLAAQSRVLGSDHPDTLFSRAHFARSLYTAGDRPRALPLLEQALSDCERVLGGEHPQTLVSRNALALACRDAGDADRAIALYEHTLTACVDVLGDAHPFTQAVRRNVQALRNADPSPR